MTDVQLALPGVEVTPLGAIITRPLQPDERARAIDALLAVENTSKWVLGDLIVADIAEHGLAETSVAYGSTNLERSGVAKAAAVAAKFPMDCRYADLSWSHHHRVVRMSDHDAHVWLAQAVDEGWTVHEMGAHIRLADEERQPELDPVVFTLPKPPEALVREFMAEDPDVWLAWQPSTNTVQWLRKGSEDAA